MSVPGDVEWRASAHSEPMGAGHIDQLPVNCSVPRGAVIVAIDAHCPAVATLVAASHRAARCDASTSDAPS